MYPLQGQVQQILKHVEHSHDFLTIIYLNKVTPPHALTLNATPQFANLTPKEPKGSIPSNQYKHRKGSNLSLSRLLYIPTFELVSMGKRQAEPSIIERDHCQCQCNPPPLVPGHSSLLCKNLRPKQCHAICIWVLESASMDC